MDDVRTSLLYFARKRRGFETWRGYQILEKITGRDFLKTTKEEFRNYGMPGALSERRKTAKIGPKKFIGIFKIL